MTEEWPDDCPLPEWLEVTIRRALAKHPGRRRRWPRVAHQRQIALTKTLAYYAVLNHSASFAQDLAALFNGRSANEDWWAHKLAAFVAKWPLPPEALKDLTWSYILWERRPVRSPQIVPGGRWFPAMPISARLALQYGYRVRPPRSMNRDDVERGARRLFERAIAGKSWYTIAGDEGQTAYPRDTRAQRTQVANFADELGIALPKIKAGRPPRARST